jgi:hypothetical protein
MLKCESQYKPSFEANLRRDAIATVVAMPLAFEHKKFQPDKNCAKIDPERGMCLRLS